MTAHAPADDSIRAHMDQIYRLQRYIYDVTRKYYLLGRDRLIRDLNARPGEVVCEVGCGTARNLIKMAKAWPGVRFVGFDASEEMLKTARGSLERAGLTELVPIGQSYAQTFDPKALFGVERPLDRIVYSYTLSMIPGWKEAIDHSLSVLKPGGTMHIVDFGDQAGLPEWFRKILYWWLSLFSVHFRPEMLAYIQSLAAEGRISLTLTPLYRGYAWMAVVTK